ncbi:hypothetical protein HBZS_109060 [Helicobacter bizzozeronii CCUG 35545]|nr:hypothetical protein HBZS_109060 [Helicobacter bizzozeronii CCUG 35545]
MKVLKLTLASGALCVGLNAQTIGLNVFPEYQAKPDQEMLDLAGKIEARKVIEYLSEMKNRYNKMTPKHKADFQKQFQDNLAKNLAKLKPSERKQRLATIKKDFSRKGSKYQPPTRGSGRGICLHRLLEKVAQFR